VGQRETLHDFILHNVINLVCMGSVLVPHTFEAMVALTTSLPETPSFAKVNAVYHIDNDLSESLSRMLSDASSRHCTVAVYLVREWLRVETKSDE
jgi:hypothetical protein